MKERESADLLETVVPATGVERPKKRKIFKSRGEGRTPKKKKSKKSQIE